jgi:transglutaminase-like putative cysteine protease
VIYDIRQITSYSYASKVSYARHVLRLTPVDRPGQHVHASALDIDPVPVGRREGTDFFGNRMTWIALNAPHDRLVVKVAARVTVEDIDYHDLFGSPPWEELRDAVFMTTDFGPMSPAHFVFPSRQVPLDPEIREYARESFPPGRPVLDGAIELMQRIKDDFVYEIGVTTVSTTAPMSFALRRGVCQDFAHIMISGLRALGIPAAYVSGYLRTAQRPEDVTLQGANAMHAWVLVWCGGSTGWYGLDPTNAVHAGTEHAVLAIGRDYADVAPIDGVVFASGGQKISVEVSVIPVG